MEEHLLKDKLIYGLKEMNYFSAINIGYGIDENFIRPMGISMTSIVKNNIDKKIIFHIFIDKISDKNKKILKKFAEKCNKTVIIYIINSEIFNGLPHTKHFSMAMYNRFLMPKILNKIVDKIIYIDADIQCFGKLDDLLNINFENKIIAVVNDVKYVRNQQIKYLKLKNKKYFNSGFMYIDIKKWNEKDISKKLMEVSFKLLNKLKWQDQDALNIVFDDKCIYLSKKYNYILNMKHKNAVMMDDAIFVHYVGKYKPWTKWCMHPLKEKFLLVAKESLWKDEKLIEPSNYKQMKMMGRSSFIYKHYIKAVYWYLKYAFYKLKNKI